MFKLSEFQGFDRAAAVVLFGENGQGGAAREALATLDYLIGDWERTRAIDATNMRHVYASAELLRAAVRAADMARVGAPVSAPYYSAPYFYEQLPSGLVWAVSCHRPDSEPRRVAETRSAADARAIVAALNGSL